MYEQELSPEAENIWGGDCRGTRLYVSDSIQIDSDTV